uniref:Uncharacterized protein n=1 Tax=Arundo donax TaxID=35708 RepID=A0A0A9CDV6_ARUDO
MDPQEAYSSNQILESYEIYLEKRLTNETASSASSLLDQLHGFLVCLNHL